MRKWSRVMSTPQDPLSLDRKSPNPHDTYPRDPLLNGLRLPLPKSAPHGSCTGQARGLRSKCHLYLRAEKKLSMYACVTKVIPEADVNDPFKISAYMVDREKRVEKFQLETNEMSAYESCNSIWSIIINKQ